MAAKNKSHDSQDIMHRTIPLINGSFPHIYERGMPRTNSSIRFPNFVLDDLILLSKIYGLDRWAVINMAIQSFKAENGID